MTFVLVGNSVRIALPVLQAAYGFQDANCLIAGGQETLGLRWSSLCRRHVLIDLDDDAGSVRLINGIAERDPDATLVPFDCDGIRLVNRVRSKLALPSIPVPDLPTLEMLDDKWRFYEFCVANAIPVPATRYVGAKADLDFGALEAEFGLPFVVKPTNWSGSIGVQIVRDRGDVEEKIRDNASYRFGSLIAQRYVDGVDMGINVLSLHGRLCAFSIQSVVNWPLIEFVPNAAMEDIAAKICHDSGYHGVMNVDVRLEEGTGKVFLMEANPRFWATLAAAAACGLNFLAESVKQSSGGDSPRRLTSGRYDTRHPLLVPSAWWRIASDPSASGRLLRARLFDVYSLGRLAQEIPAMASRRVRRGASSLMRSAPAPVRSSTASEPGTR
ncbi:MAG TPA: ATP-grasp domain-containing protein [Ramlibacter sp.]|nr:ATP-grasp domain-containing protein [Ramlibacter sp.]